MDFLDPNKKRSNKIKLYLGYVLMGIAICLGAVVLLYAAYGYGIDRKGNVFQNGLVFLASTPDAAEVKITSEDKQRTQTAVTSDRLTLPAGKYAFEFLKQGYRPWQRTVELKGGGIQRLVYPFLFPEKLEPSDINPYAKQPEFITVSPDRGTIIVQRPSGDGEFDVYDANEPSKAPTNFTLDKDLLSSAQKSQDLELVEWSTNNRHLLVKHSFDKKSEYIVIDRETPGASVNINKIFEMNPKKVLLRDKNPDQLYIQRADNKLLSADVSDETTSTVVESALAFAPHGSDMLLYVAKEAGTVDKNVGVFMLTDDKTYKLRELPESPTYLLDLAQFNNNWLVAAGSTNDDRVYVYRNPVNIIKANNPNTTLSIRTMRIADPEHISFSANTQFIAVQSGQNFDVYDALDDRQYHYTINTEFSKNSDKAIWMDGHRLLSVTDNKVTVFDFDGSNYQVLSEIIPGTQPMFDSDFSTMFSLAPSMNKKNSTALIQTPLRVTAN